MTAPKYIGLQKEQIPTVDLDKGKVKVHVVSGNWGDVQGPIQNLSDIHMAGIALQESGKFTYEVPSERNIFFYVVRGAVEVNGQEADKLTLVEFVNEGSEVEVKATEDAYILFGHALPFKEPVVAHGPFVMNTDQEIREAFQDYQSGKMGQWK